MITPSLKRWGTGNRVKVTLSSRDFLDGLLLGDGYYGSPSVYSAFFRLNQKALHEDWVLNIGKRLEDIGIKYKLGEVPPQVRVTKTGAVINAAASVYVQSLSYRDLIQERDRWYRGNVKILPKDIRLGAQELLAHWYMGDGNFSVNRENKSVNVRLHTNAFSEADVAWLSKSFANVLGLKTTINHWRRQPILCLQNENASRFLDFVRPYISKSFLYKAPEDCWKPSKCEVCGLDLIGRPRFTRFCHQHRRERMLAQNRERARALRKINAPVV